MSETVFEDILNLVSADLYDDSSDILGCGAASMSLLRRSIGLLSLPNLQQTVDVTESLISLSTDKFYAYPYKHVPRCWRRLYVDASLVQCIARFRRGEYLDAVRGIDMALIMAGGEGRQTELERLLHHLEQVLVKRIKYDIPETFDITKPTLSLRYPIPRISPPSLDTFQKHMTTKHTPLVLTDSIINWPALQSWSSPSYLLKRTLNGSRLVPIELGESYVSDSWTQKLVPFSSFLHDHLLKQSHPRGYLAQHDLLSQIPALRNDILVPDYCHVIPPQSPPDCPRVAYIETDDITMNIWLGPQETKSPLHNDPYENIFAQVVGYKYFRLYPPRMTDKIYPRGLEGGIQMGNTSQVDVENPDLARFPMFKDAEFVETLIGPGECLYIPRGWWHFVRSESVSIGVSFWW